MNNLVLRIITALVGAIVIIGSIFLSVESFILVFVIISVFAHYEYIKTIRHTTNKSPRFEIFYSLFVGLYLIIVRLQWHVFQIEVLPVPNELWMILLIGFIIAELYYNRENPIQQVGLNILGIYYIPYAFTTFMKYGISSGYDIDTTVNLWFATGLLFMVWFNDSFAYFAGRLFGKHKLFERISPKKTWEGFWGGMIMTIGCSIGLSFLFSELSMIQWIIWAVIVAFSATLGDLAESLLKRSIHIKDSGSLLPGHGGFLDRFDGFVLAVPFSALYLSILTFYNDLTL